MIECRQAFSNLILFRAVYNNSENKSKVYTLKGSAAEFPLLSAVAKEIFSAQAISAQSERDFSGAGLFAQM